MTVEDTCQASLQDYWYYPSDFSLSLSLFVEADIPGGRKKSRSHDATVVLMLGLGSEFFVFFWKAICNPPFSVFFFWLFTTWNKKCNKRCFSPKTMAFSQCFSSSAGNTPSAGQVGSALSHRNKITLLFFNVMFSVFFLLMDVNWNRKWILIFKKAFVRMCYGFIV